MFNLLPQDHQKALKKEYGRRRMTLVLMGVCCVGISALITLFPSLILSIEKEKELSTEDKNFSVDLRKNITDLNSSIDLLRQEMSLVVAHVDSVNPSDIFTQVIKKKPSGIILKSLLYKKQGEDPLRFSIVGVAKTRDNLLSFTKELEKLTFFDHVNIPVSNFAKEKDIEFSLDLIEAKKQ